MLNQSKNRTVMKKVAVMNIIGLVNGAGPPVPVRQKVRARHLDPVMNGGGSPGPHRKEMGLGYRSHQPETTAHPVLDSDIPCLH